MKKSFKYFVFSLLIILGFSINVNAESLPAVNTNTKTITLDKDYSVPEIIFDNNSGVDVIDLNGHVLTVRSSIKFYGKTKIKNGTIIRSQSMLSGPMIWVEGETAHVTLDNVVIDGNKIECTGVGNFGIYGINNSKVTINDSTLINHYNTTSVGASIYLDSANELVINNGKLKNNQSFNESGGGSSIFGRNLEKIYINKTSFENNVTGGSGTIKLERIKDFVFDEHSVLRNNKASGGAGMHLSDVNAVISGLIEENVSSDNGGGIYTLSNNNAYNDRIIKITNKARIINNTSSCAGGGLYVNSYKENIPSKVIIEGATFTGNKAEGLVDASNGLYKDIGGGAIAVARGVLEINDIKMSNNKSNIELGNSILVSHANGNLNGGKLTINGGKFDDTIALGAGSIVVNGGTFIQDMSKYIINTKLISKKTENGYEVGENKVLSNNNISFENKDAMENNHELVIVDKSSLLKDEKINNKIKEVILANSKKAKDIETLALYDISVTDGTNEIEMKDGKYKITFKLNEDQLKYSAYAAVYIDDEGNVTYLPVTITKETATFETTHLSTYGIVGYNDIANPETNFNIEIIIGVILLGLMIYIIRQKMKNKEFVEQE